MKAGDRVQIKIVEPNRWTESAVEMFNDCLGTIKEVKVRPDFRNTKPETLVLVQFDEPQLLPHTRCISFHFSKDDLTVL